MVLVFREYILIVHLPKDCATHFTIDWEQNMKTYRNPIIERKMRLASMGNFHAHKMIRPKCSYTDYYMYMELIYRVIEHLLNIQ